MSLLVNEPTRMFFETFFYITLIGVTNPSAPTLEPSPRFYPPLFSVYDKVSKTKNRMNLMVNLKKLILIFTLTSTLYFGESLVTGKEVLLLPKFYFPTSKVNLCDS